jgi:hypothetical protein
MIALIIPAVAPAACAITTSMATTSRVVATIPARPPSFPCPSIVVVTVLLILQVLAAIWVETDCMSIARVLFSELFGVVFQSYLA